MIRGKVRIDLTPETVLQRISEFDIFKLFMPHSNWELNKVTNSPLHEDQNPSFIIGNKNGYLYFVDFSSGQRGGCFDFVMELYHLSSLDEALRLVDKRFGLGFSPNTNTGEYKIIKSQYKQPEETLGKRYSLIQVVTRKFTKEELEYWSAYYQDIQDLRSNHVFSIEKMYLNRRLFPLKETELRFGYLYGSYWKIYRPHASKKDKWISNVPIATAYGLENLCREKNTLITKSLKDYMVCRKVYPNVCHIQNESLAAISKETAEYIATHSKSVFYGGDSDSAGKAASYIITKAFGWKHINPPDYLLNDCCKDFSDWSVREGLEKLELHFKTKGLIE